MSATQSRTFPFGRLAISSVAATCLLGADGSACGPKITTNEVEVSNAVGAWKRTVGSNATYGWDEPELASRPLTNVAPTRAILRGSHPRDFYVFTQSNGNYAPFGPPTVNLGMRWAKTGSFSGASAPWTITTHWDVGAARLIDHGACRLEYATVKRKDGASPGSDGRFVRNDPKATWLENDPDHTGLLVDVANTINAESHATNARRIEANFQTMFAKWPRELPEPNPNDPNQRPRTNPQIDGNVVNDGFLFNIAYNGCEVGSYIPPATPIYVCATVKVKAAYQIHAETAPESPYLGFVRALPLYVDVDVSDIPGKSRREEKKKYFEDKLGKMLPEKMWLQIRDKLSLPSTAKEANRGHAWCLESIRLTKDGPMVPRMLAGLHGLLSGAIKAADKISKPAADAKALDIVNRMDPSRIYYAKTNYDDEDEIGTCKFAFKILRVDVLPDKYEFVLQNADGPRPAEVEALSYLSPGDLKCSTSEVPVDGQGLFNAVYHGPEEKYGD